MNASVGEMLPSDCRSVVQLLREAFPERLIANTPLSQPQAERYLNSRVGAARLIGDELHTVVREKDGSVVAYCHAMKRGTTSHLNYLATSKRNRSQGLAGLLLSDWCNWATAQGSERLTLHVDGDNGPARDLYSGLGFRDLGRHFEYRMTEVPSAAQGSRSVELSDWVASEAWQLAYGFSDLRLWCAGNQYSVRRVGQRLYRAEWGLPAEVQGYLQRLFPRPIWLLRASSPVRSRKLVLEGVTHTMALEERRP